MVKPDDGKSALGARLAEIASAVVGFLDPHLRPHADAGKASGEEPWPLRRTIFYVVCISLLLWGIAYLVFRVVL
jgi:hypothetical protein